MAFAFKLNPKQAVEQKARSLFGRDAKVKIMGCRPTPQQAADLSVPSGTYYVEVLVNGNFVGSAYHFNWRKAYPLLNDEMQKYFDKSKAQV
jgi:outer membrane usher protein FimD/PapC